MIREPTESLSDLSGADGITERQRAKPGITIRRARRDENALVRFYTSAAYGGDGSYWM
jgi:hypothetical protein